MAIWRTRIAYWIPKAKKAHSEYVILTAFSLQQWVQERVSMLRYAYSACRVVCMCLVPSTGCYLRQVHNVWAILELWSNWDHTEPLAFRSVDVKKCK